MMRLFIQDNRAPLKLLFQALFPIWFSLFPIIYTPPLPQEQKLNGEWINLRGTSFNFTTEYGYVIPIGPELLIGFLKPYTIQAGPEASTYDQIMRLNGSISFCTFCPKFPYK